jgi:hypothetical protein
MAPSAWVRGLAVLLQHGFEASPLNLRCLLDDASKRPSGKNVMRPPSSGARPVKATDVGHDTLDLKVPACGNLTVHFAGDCCLTVAGAWRMTPRASGWPCRTIARVVILAAMDHDRGCPLRASVMATLITPVSEAPFLRNVEIGHVAAVP